MTEVGGDGAVYIDPTDEVVAACTIAEALKDQQAFRKSGYLNVMRFSNEAMITGYLDAYMTVLAGAALKGLATGPGELRTLSIRMGRKYDTVCKKLSK
jgi:hypothetical protein